MERIMIEENKWDHNMEVDVVEGPGNYVGRGEVVHSSNKMKTGKAPGPSDVSLELITASRGVGIQVMV